MSSKFRNFEDLAHELLNKKQIKESKARVMTANTYSQQKLEYVIYEMKRIIKEISQQKQKQQSIKTLNEYRDIEFNIDKNEKEILFLEEQAMNFLRNIVREGK